MNYQQEALEIIRNKKALMISGGGVLGTALLKTVERLTELGLSLSNIQKIKGSSVGSIIATAIACGATIEYMNETISTMNFNDFRDHDCFLRSLFQLIFKYGLNETKSINRFASKILSDLVGNADITFSQLFERTGVHLIITYLSMNLEETIYADYINEPNSLVRETIVKSSSIPFFYEGYFTKVGKTKYLAVDGGTLDNYSFNYLRNVIEPEYILGLKLVSGDDIKDETNVGIENAIKHRDRGFPKTSVEYFTRLVYLMRREAMKIHVKENDWMSSVKINVGKLTSTDFQITAEQKKWLFEQGRKAADDYVEELANLIKDGKYPYLYDL